jgi:hypothetical protein
MSIQNAGRLEERAAGRKPSSKKITHHNQSRHASKKQDIDPTMEEKGLLLLPNLRYEKILVMALAHPQPTFTTKNH